jgi:pimeloyl-ACP methyl ester carboxylesterase
MAKSGGKVLIVLLVIIFLMGGGAYALLYTVTHPPRDKSRIDPADLLLRTDDVTFRASDGVLLSGWLVKGTPRAPAIIMCHDLGGSRSSFLGSAVPLNRAGYPVLVFDFRGHGLSAGSGGFLGVDEAHDIAGAIEFLQTRSDVDGGRIGLWGIGMGAYAGALAAVDHPEVKALALDSLYPEVSAQMDRLVGAQIPPAFHFILPVLHTLYEPYLALRPGRTTSLSSSLLGLSSRNVLLIAATSPSDRYEEEKALYAAIPEGPEGGKNLLEVKASVVTGLYAEDKKTYDDAIVRFFASSLPKDGARKPLDKGIQIRER